MRILLQRVRSARVTVVQNDADTDVPVSATAETTTEGSEESQSIDSGLLLLVGVQDSDTDAEIAWMVHKVANLRIFEDSEGKMNRSLLQTGGSVLSVSQFTLYADTRKGNRPSFMHAGRPERAEQIWAKFNLGLERLGIAVRRGVFGAHMLVDLQNDGPVTIMLDTDDAPSHHANRRED
ncbi:D-aminoacyl-tRNA deacylase [Bifidobacterium crudilactis]|jgi:D-tyrosyl-tRNA(Tyr) deacylase|uniref:D-aminoacyl-tRNA deacylase n=1 Tax=Bifidobacterium crudilactis TaxID=327277 RepID=UPI0023537465|nr:D-aminoacyl-tRNA deacylase [Bifidobacterium crudilactis]MCI1867520.1 D-aminoacyl-tRNA deacylase [Bifidobacterium crudilactis]MDN5972845.1 D-aminoacyl-tRNA deacylase [Bifidobacterium crudilactis]MDN6000142.1 D-aminoacyl-tRNA deacylase [Bifidobacterium crudilactis]MDN6210022.1 D-aminoacyl-tRNA deacylase [Bifidobacterium crudilactis]MDN6233688.1 D-aminoacyl-tRNA deacylase [Bifidobacterium crudilactis]